MAKKEKTVKRARVSKQYHDIPALGYINPEKFVLNVITLEIVNVTGRHKPRHSTPDMILNEQNTDDSQGAEMRKTTVALR